LANTASIQPQAYFASSIK